MPYNPLLPPSAQSVKGTINDPNITWVSGDEFVANQTRVLIATRYANSCAGYAEQRERQRWMAPEHRDSSSAFERTERGAYDKIHKAARSLFSGF